MWAFLETRPDAPLWYTARVPFVRPTHTPGRVPMRRRWQRAFVSTAALALLTPAAFAQDGRCERLARLSLPTTQITSAETVAAGAFVPPGLPAGAPAIPAAAVRNLPAFCRVAATLTPTSDSDVKIEVWLPASGWNGKFQGVGNGGWSGAIVYFALAAALRDGYATASTDTGHSGGSGSFALGHPEKLIDFGYRAVHEMTLKAKSIVKAYYGEAPRLSYWNGCSSGGKQGLKEAQRFPEDYDGIIAGAPANNWTHLEAQQIWIAQAVHRDEASFIPASKYPLIHRAVIHACDALDGVIDGLLENPAACRFDPSVLQCKAGDEPTCLTAAQVDSARKIYSPEIGRASCRERV